METVTMPNSPMAAAMTSIDSKYVPVKVKPGLVAESAAAVGLTMMVIDVPTRSFSVAYVSDAA